MSGVLTLGGADGGPYFDSAEGLLFCVLAVVLFAPIVMERLRIPGLIGLIVASIVNIFLGSSALGFAISIVGVLVFVGLTAWDTQKIKESYDVGFGHEVLAKGAIMGALSLYLDFINLFTFLLQFMGNRN